MLEYIYMALFSTKSEGIGPKGISTYAHSKEGMESRLRPILVTSKENGGYFVVGCVAGEDEETRRCVEVGIVVDGRSY